MKKIKICFISPSAYPLFNPKCKATFGGAEVDTYLIARELAKDKEFDVHFITADFGQKSIEIYDSVKVNKSYNLNSSRIISAIILTKIIKKVGADIYFQESANAGTGLVALLCKSMRKKFVYRTASEIDCNNEFIKKNKFEGIFYKYGIKNADFVITQNKINKTQLKDNLDIESKVIKNAISINKPAWKNSRYILWVARSARLKNPRLFLELARAFPEEDFLMICSPANEDSEKNIESESKTLKNITFLSYVPFNEVDKYFRNSKIFVNTSDYEGFPNTFVQAAMNSTPIVSLNVNPDSFLTRYKCGFCAEGDFELMKIDIRKLLKNKKMYKEMSNNAYNYAKNNHDIKEIIKAYKDIFKNIHKK